MNLPSTPLWLARRLGICLIDDAKFDKTVDCRLPSLEPMGEDAVSDVGGRREPIAILSFHLHGPVVYFGVFKRM